MTCSSDTRSRVGATKISGLWSGVNNIGKRSSSSKVARAGCKTLDRNDGWESQIVTTFICFRVNKWFYIVKNLVLQSYIIS